MSSEWAWAHTVRDRQTFCSSMSDQAVFVKDSTPYGCGAVCFHTCNNLMINTMWVLTHWRVYWRCFKTDSNLSISTDWTVLIQSLNKLKEQLNSSWPMGVQLSLRDVEVYFRTCQNSVTSVWNPLWKSSDSQVKSDWTTAVSKQDFYWTHTFTYLWLSLIDLVSGSPIQNYRKSVNSLSVKGTGHLKITTYVFFLLPVVL